MKYSYGIKKKEVKDILKNLKFSREEFLFFEQLFNLDRERIKDETGWITDLYEKEYFSFFDIGQYNEHSNNTITKSYVFGFVPVEYTMDYVASTLIQEYYSFLRKVPAYEDRADDMMETIENIQDDIDSYYKKRYKNIDILKLDSFLFIYEDDLFQDLIGVYRVIPRNVLNNVYKKQKYQCEICDTIVIPSIEALETFIEEMKYFVEDDSVHYVCRSCSVKYGNKLKDYRLNYIGKSS